MAKSRAGMLRVAVLGNLCNTGFAITEGLRKEGFEADHFFFRDDTHPGAYRREYQTTLPSWSRVLNFQSCLGRIGFTCDLLRYNLVISCTTFLLRSYLYIPFCILKLRPYMVYSTGSDLRELPWVKRRLGRKAVRYYANASKVYISNFDRYTYNALRYLGLLSYMTFPLPYTPFHKPSGESLGPWREILARVGFFKNKYKWVVLLASSLDWTEHRFRWTKRSDIFLRGYSRFVQEGHDVGCIIRQSGVDKENIHNLIEELGIQDQCMFIPTVDNLVLPSVFRMVDVVADQFDIGTFGGTALEAMSAGKPVLVKIDSSYHNMVYSSHAPILNCGDESDVYLHLKRLDSADYRDEIGKAAKEWLKTNNLFDQSVARLADDIHILFKDWDRSLVRLNPLY